MEKQVLEILLRKLAAGNILPEEEAKLQQYMDQLSAEEIDQLFPRQEWENSGTTYLQSSEEAAKTETAYQLVADRLGLNTEKPVIQLQAHRSWWQRRWVQAACVAALIASGLFLYTTSQYGKQKNISAANPIRWEQVNTVKGEQRTIQLPDGSVLYVNGGSTIRYPEKFSGSQRQVELVAGEIFLEVQRNEALPFVVTTAGTEVKVLGTSFTVENRPEDRRIEVAVKTGKVSFGTIANKQAALLLTPGKKGIFEKEQGSLQTATCNAGNVGGWRDNEFAFEDATLTQILNTLEYRYGLQYKIRRSELRNKLFKATFRQRQPDEIIRVLSMLGDFKYYKKDAVVVIY